MVEVSIEDFEHMVSEAYDALPKDMVGGLTNVAIVVEDQPDGARPRLYGLYRGHPVTRRANYGLGQLPDKITLYRNTIAGAVSDFDQLRERIRIVLVHEIGHYFGLSDARLQELGWA